MSKRFLTCSITGNLTRPEQNPALPITPEQIADSALEAAEAGAAVVHIHVRHPDGRPSMEIQHYREVIERIRDRNTALIINLTTGPGGRFQPGDDDPRIAGPRTNLLRPEQRVPHITELRPDIGTLDLNTMTFGREVVINIPSSVRRMAEMIYEAGVVPEVELFDTGDIHLMSDLIAEGSLKEPILCSLVTGVQYGFPADSRTMAFAAAQLPPSTRWSGFGIGRHAFPMVAQSFLLGGNIRIGFEDTVFIERGKLAASNGELVQKARWIVEALGGSLMSAEETREHLGLGAGIQIPAGR